MLSYNNMTLSKAYTDSTAAEIADSLVKHAEIDAIQTKVANLAATSEFLRSEAGRMFGIGDDAMAAKLRDATHIVDGLYRTANEERMDLMDAARERDESLLAAFLANPQ